MLTRAVHCIYIHMVLLTTRAYFSNVKYLQQQLHHCNKILLPVKFGTIAQASYGHFYNNICLRYLGKPYNILSF